MDGLGPADRAQLERVAGIVRDVLGDRVAGAALFGSAVLGGLRPRSDLDVLVVTRRPTTREEKGQLAERLGAISGRTTPDGRWRRVELTVVAEPEIRPWRMPPRMDFQFGDWLREAFAADDPAVWQARESPDLAVLLTMTREAGVALLGPPPAEMLAPVPHEDLLAATADDLDGVIAGFEAEDTCNVVLALARIWSTTATGAIRSKDAAADWALERLPEQQRPVLARARTIYLSGEEERWDDLRPQVAPHIEHVAGEIRRARLATRHDVAASRTEPTRP